MVSHDGAGWTRVAPDREHDGFGYYPPHLAGIRSGQSREKAGRCIRGSVLMAGAHQRIVSGAVVALSFRTPPRRSNPCLSAPRDHGQPARGIVQGSILSVQYGFR
jgi:hypothetical protein